MDGRESISTMELPLRKRPLETAIGTGTVRAGSHNLLLCDWLLRRISSYVMAWLIKLVEFLRFLSEISSKMISDLVVTELDNLDLPHVSDEIILLVLDEVTLFDIVRSVP